MGQTTGPVVAVVIAATVVAGHHEAVISGADDACLDCHGIEPALSHPVGVVPSMAVPPDLPLVGGRIACVTCHDVWAPGDVAVTVTDCTRCHDASRSGDVHAVAAMRAHLAWEGDPAGGERTSPGLGPDAESRVCLSCHDGAVATGVGERYGRGPVSFDRVTTRHPIGVEQRPRGPGDNLVDPDLLDPRIRLFDGRLGCGSCHSPYSGAPNLLVLSNSGSALCLSCHAF